MNYTGLGDLSQSFALRQSTVRIRQEIDQLTQELTSGQISDPKSALRGNLSFLTDVERQSAVLDSYGVAAKEAETFTTLMQLALTNFGDIAQDLSGALLTAGTSTLGSSVIDISNNARAALDSLVGTLNGDVAGRSFFAGNATDARPVADTDTILTDLTAALAGATTPADIMAAAQAWFADPLGFEASAYQGSTAPLSDFRLSAEDTVTVDVRATDPGLTRTLASAAVAALAADPALALDIENQTELLSLAGEDLLLGSDEVTGVQARVGLAQGEIDKIATRNAATLTSLNIAKNALLEADPFETATRLEEAQFQLQSLYSVTVRNSQLSLLNFL
ncbi:MAG: flagellin [Pseudomonadota bacterium]